MSTTEQSPDESAPAPAPDSAEAAADGYSFDGPTLDLGALMVDGAPDPGAQIRIPLAMMNRHGLVAGATGTGKTKTLQGLAEQLSAAGVPVFLADIKGDLSGLGVPGEQSEKLLQRTSALGQNWTPTAFPVEFYSLGGKEPGIPIRATPTSFGPTLLAKILGLNDTQTSCLELIFHWADTQGLLLLDLKDVRSVVSYLTSDEGKAELKNVGGVSAATAGVILRELTSFEAKGAECFFGEPAFDVKDLIRTAPDGRGMISVLELATVQSQPDLLSTFLMWLLAELFQTQPEVGDSGKPKLVFFFDEAHLLFRGASKHFIESVTQTVRLIRSKGIGIFFVTQTPKDVPADVLAQLANRVQHALRAFTPDDAKALKATVSTFPKSDYDLATVLTSLAIGEAVVTVMSETGAPTPVAWTRLRAPQSLMAPMDADKLAAAVSASPLQAQYGQMVDRDSAYEMLDRRLAEKQAAETQAETARLEAAQAAQAEAAQTAAAHAEAAAAKAAARPAPRTSTKPTPRAPAPANSLDAVLNSKFAKNLASSTGRELVRGLLGALKR